MTQFVFVDSSALLAMIDARDKYHALAAAFARDYLGDFQPLYRQKLELCGLLSLGGSPALANS